MKHRTQILLEDWQYETLRQMAQKEGTTLSSLLRDWISQKIKSLKPARKKSLMQFAGSLSDLPDVATEHDRYLGLRK